MLRFLYAMDVFKTSQKRLVFTGIFTRCFNLKSVFVCRECFKKTSLKVVSSLVLVALNSYSLQFNLVVLRRVFDSIKQFLLVEI